MVFCLKAHFYLKAQLNMSPYISACLHMSQFISTCFHIFSLFALVIVVATVVLVRQPSKREFARADFSRASTVQNAYSRVQPYPGVTCRGH